MWGLPHTPADSLPWVAACPASPSPHSAVGAVCKPGGGPCPIPASCLPSWPCWHHFLGGHQEDREREEGTFVQAPSDNGSLGQGQAEGPMPSPLPSSFPAL